MEREFSLLDKKLKSKVFGLSEVQFSYMPIRSLHLVEINPTGPSTKCLKQAFKRTPKHRRLVHCEMRAIKPAHICSGPLLMPSQARTILESIRTERVHRGSQIVQLGVAHRPVQNRPDLSARTLDTSIVVD